MFNFELTERGYLRKHESSDLEYKENFHRGDEMLRCQGDGTEVNPEGWTQLKGSNEKKNLV
jgi:hypothetical protein